MKTYKVEAYISKAGSLRVTEHILFVSAKNEKHAKNKIRYIYRKAGQTAIIKNVKAA